MHNLDTDHDSDTGDDSVIDLTPNTEAEQRAVMLSGLKAATTLARGEPVQLNGSALEHIGLFIRTGAEMWCGLESSKPTGRTEQVRELMKIGQAVSSQLAEMTNGAVALMPIPGVLAQEVTQLLVQRARERLGELFSAKGGQLPN